MRYRKQSLRTMLGVTSTKKKIKKDLGIYEITKVLNTSNNTKRSIKRAIGYESEGMKFFRFIQKLLK